MLKNILNNVILVLVALMQTSQLHSLDIIELKIC